MSIEQGFAGSSGFLLARLGAEARRLWARMLAEHDLTPHQFGVLMALDGLGESYQQRPRRRFVGARTQEFRFARYVEDWRAKIERVGESNYPQATPAQWSRTLDLNLRAAMLATQLVLEPMRQAGGGVVEGGQHIKAAKDTPMANVMLTLLHGLGLEHLESFGDSTGEFSFAAQETTVAPV